MKPEILTFSGNYFDLLNPHLSDFNIKDIAHALSHICRFTGHTQQFYSVAQHSVLVSQVVPPEHALAGLLHDAAEAFIGDVSSPLKSLLPDYKIIEARIEAAVLGRFGLDPKMHPAVKHADLVLLCTERRDVMHPAQGDWTIVQDFTPLPSRILPWTSAQACAAFIARYDAIRQIVQLPQIAVFS